MRCCPLAALAGDDQVLLCFALRSFVQLAHRPLELLVSWRWDSHVSSTAGHGTRARSGAPAPLRDIVPPFLDPTWRALPLSCPLYSTSADRAALLIRDRRATAACLTTGRPVHRLFNIFSGSSAREIRSLCSTQQLEIYANPMLLPPPEEPISRSASEREVIALICRKTLLESKCSIQP